MHDAPAIPEPAPRSPRWIFTGAVLGTAAVVVLLIYADGRKLVAVAGRLDVPLLVLPLLCTLGSYAAMALSYQRIACLAGLDIAYGEMVRVALVSTAANYLVSTGGLSGLAARTYYFSHRHQLSWGTAFSISLAQTFITNLVLLAFLFWGVLHLALSGKAEGVSLALASALFVLSLVLCVAAVGSVAHRRTRHRLFASAIRVADRLSKRFVRNPAGLRARLRLFEEELHEGVDFMISRGWKMLLPVAYICLDWFLMLATLYTCFRCVREPVALSVVVIGFALGVFLSLINLVPGGLGIMEGSMSAVFAGLGVPLESAVVATLLYRIFYYLLPLAVSLALFRSMMPPAVGVDPRDGRLAEHPAP
ncbi:MAG: glycosyltransferase 2 family protein [Candidatus Binatota bacterium]|nr:glycosyltransferase 2 family protein [Candidatus Binatota bacterium]